MDGIKWFKMYVGFHNNKKIKQLVQLPNGTDYITTWVFLLDLAAEVNDDGMIYFTKEIPYTDEMLAVEMGLPLQVIRQAMYYLEQFRMIEIVDNVKKISNWARYQNVASMDRVREQTRKRVAAHRAAKKIEQKGASAPRNATCNVTVTEAVTQACNVTVTHENAKCNAVEKENREEEKRNTPLRECNAHALAHESVTDDELVIFLGEYGNVIMKPDEYLQLQEDFPDDYKDRIDNLSRYMKSKGVDYDDHYATIRKWAIEDAKKNKTGSGGKSGAFSYDGQREYTSDEYADLELKMRQRRTGATEDGSK